jgi:hypothetical protein
MTRSRSINDRKPRITQHDFPKIRNPLIVRPAVRLRAIHPHNRIRGNLLRTKNAGDTTHLSV